MKKFMVLYRSTVSAEELMANSTPEQMQAGMDAWMQWAQKCGDAIVDMGSPLGAAKKVKVGGVGDSRSQVSGFSVLQAESLDEATALVEGHPHLMSPGEPTIVVLEYLPVPGM